MDSSQEHVVQQLLDTIFSFPEDVQRKVCEELDELIDNIPELPLEGSPVVCVDQTAFPSSSPLNSKETSNEKQQHTESTVDPSPRRAKQLDLGLEPSLSGSLIRGTSDAESGQTDDLHSGPAPIVRPHSDMSAGSACAAAGRDIQEEGKTDSGLGLDDSSSKAVRGSKAALGIFDLQATHVPNLGDLQVEEKNIAAAGASGSNDSIHSHLLRASNGYSPDSAPLPEENLPNRSAKHQNEPGTYTPGLRRNAGTKPFTPPVVPTMVNNQYRLPNVYGQIPFAFPYPPGIQTTSFQGYSGQTSFPYPPIPMPYPGIPAVFPPGYGQVPMPIPATSTAPQGPVRAPFGNSRRANIDVTEPPGTSEAGPSRAGRKRAKKTASGEPVVYVCDLPNCPLPGKQFYDKRELLRHQSQTKAHSKIKFYCSMCNAEFPRKDARKRHFENKHERSGVVTKS